MVTNVTNETKNKCRRVEIMDSVNRCIEDEVETRILFAQLETKAGLNSIEIEYVEYLLQGFNSVEWAQATNRDKRVTKGLYRKVINLFRAALIEAGELMKDEPKSTPYEQARKLREKGYSFPILVEIFGRNVSDDIMQESKSPDKKRGTFCKQNNITRPKKSWNSPHCAICGRNLRGFSLQLCKSCFEKYGIEEPWVKYLMQLKNHDDWEESNHFEFSFTDNYMDQNGEFEHRDRNDK